MRLISYNILDGGEGRADPLAEVIEAQRPDIVALVEADNLAVLERIAGRLKMDFIHAPGEKSAAALLSRWPIEGTINHAIVRDGIEKSFLEADVLDPIGQSWSIGVVHLHARAFELDEQQREREIEIVLDTFAKRRAAHRPHLLVGDFNSNGPHQKIDAMKCKPATREAWEENGHRLPRRVVQRILDAGYVDTLCATEPSISATAGTFTTQYPGQRVDYVFAWGFAGGSMKSAWIEQDRLAKYASDHFPVGVEIEPLTDADKRG